MGTILKTLQQAVQTKNHEKLKEIVQKICKDGSNIEIENKNIIKELLNISDENSLVLRVEVVAELAKSECNRKILTDEEIVKDLVQMLNHRLEDVVVNTIRALGNICYENETACNLISEGDFLVLLNILKKDPERKSNSLTTKTCGLLVNLLTSSENLPRVALKNDVLKVLEDLLEKYKQDIDSNHSIILFLLAIVSNVSDYFDEHNINFPENLCKLVVGVFRKTENPEICVTCIEIFHGQADNDEVKKILVKEGFCESLYGLIEKHRSRVNDEDSRAVLKMACDILVLILTSDDCMNILYNNGKGKMYENMLKWLDSNDLDLLSSGILAIGNFARNDQHCQQMVKNGISKKLIDLLKKYNSVNSDIKTQHALLSALKNLIIPHENKAQVLKEGLIDVIYPLIKTDECLVIFKLLGTLRMAVDRQEAAAMDLINRKDFLERILHWCYNSDHLGIRGEVPRLVAWLIKNSNSSKPFPQLISIKNSVKCLVEMIASNHLVMQNESFIALSLLCQGTKDNDAVHKQLFAELPNAQIGKSLNFALTKNADKMDQTTLDNLICLLEHLTSNNEVANHLKAEKVYENLTKLLNNKNLKSPDIVNNIIQRIK